MKLSVGVVIVGSLFWDDQAHREEWRSKRLKLDETIDVNVPIRYGRRSRSRGNTFTMVFAPGGQLGQAKAVRCIRDVASADDLIAEAECLWAAEQPAISRPEIKYLQAGDA